MEQKSGKQVRVLLVDDQEIARQGLRRILHLEGDMEVVGEADNGEEAITKIESLSPDVVLMDVKMPNVNGIQATQQLIEKKASCAVVMLTLYDEFIVQALQAGAMGYLLKGTKREELASAIRRVSQGELVVSNSLLTEHPSIAEVVAYFQKASQEKIADERAPTGLGAKPEAHPLQQTLGPETVSLDTTYRKDVTGLLQPASDIGHQTCPRDPPASPVFSLRKQLIQPEALLLVPEAMARRLKVIPMEIDDNVLRVAMANTDDILALEALAMFTQMRIEPKAASDEEILKAIDFNYRAFEDIEERISKISLHGETTELQTRADTDTVTHAPLVQALALILDEAIKARASDIHLQPQEDKLRVRYRIDGTLSDIVTLPLETSAQLISRIKIMANMNIADHLRPQDGQFSIQPKGRRDKIDIRVGIIPTVCGEMAALRLLDKSRAFVNLAQLGFLPESLAMYEDMLKVPHGMILVSGPTGSGKTTTLYASINTLDYKGRNIITIEDPVEYRFKDINQIQVNPRAGLTFASGLRSILRLDPNVILVGEIRDDETANIAVQSALTGHLVLSSIHTNDAIGIVSRLLDLGIERFLIASAIICVVAQRMARRVCPDCARPVEVSLVERMVYKKETGDERSEFLCGSGCKSCAYTGYHGRTGIFEILRISDEIRAMLLDGANASQLRTQAIKEGMIPLLKDGMLKVKENITTPAEVLRVAYSVGEESFPLGLPERTDKKEARDESDSYHSFL